MMEKIEYTILTVKNIRQQLLNLRQLVFEVTDSCNLKCKYCGYGEFYCSYDKREDHDLPFLKAKMLLDYIFALWKEYGQDFYKHDILFSFYGGEPLLNVLLIRQIQDYIEENYAYCVSPEYSMTSNAMLLDRYMDFIVEKKIRLLISLDGDEYGQSYRVDHHGKNSFQRVYRNIKLLQEKYPNYFRERIQFNAVLHDHNNVDRIYHYIKSEFGKLPMISQLNNSGIRESKREEFNKMFVDKNSDFHKSFDAPLLINELFYDVPDTRELYNYLERYSGNIYRTYMDLLVDKKQQPFLPTGTCVPFSKKMFLTVNGKILACERIDQKFVLGYVSEKGVDLDLERIASFYNGLFEKIRIQCESCYRRLFCPQCLFYLQDLNSNVICHGYMNKKNFDRMEEKLQVYLRKNPHLYQRIIEELAIY